MDAWCRETHSFQQNLQKIEPKVLYPRDFRPANFIDRRSDNIQILTVLGTSNSFIAHAFLSWFSESSASVSTADFQRCCPDTVDLFCFLADTARSLPRVCQCI